MARTIIIESVALRDLDAHFAYLAQGDIEVARRYLHAWRVAFDQLAEWQWIGPRRDYGHPELSDMRIWPVPRFSNYLIFYRADDHRLQILRVLHGAQDIGGLVDDDS